MREELLWGFMNRQIEMAKNKARGDLSYGEPPTVPRNERQMIVKQVRDL